VTLIAPAPSEPSPWLLGLVVVAALVLLAGRELRFVYRLWRAGQLGFFLRGLQRLPAIQRSHATLRDHPAYPVEILPGPGTRPGLQIMLPARPVETGMLAPDGSRLDFQVYLAKRCFLIGRCVGRVEDQGTAWQSVTEVYESHSFVPVSAPIVTTMAGLPAMSCTVAMDDRWLTEWRFEQDGWLFSAAFLRPPDAPYAVTDLALASLETWSWRPAAAAEPTGPVLVPEPVVQPEAA
jgi:hypothetical protein